MTRPQIARTVQEVRAVVSGWRRDGLRAGLVPTMGALHQGHLSLIERIKPDVDRIMVSIFVNPMQFGPGEDYERYPRDLEADADKLATVGTDLVYAPDVSGMYPEGFASLVKVDGGLQDILCGPHRPGHFDGVTTVVAKLLNQCLPDVVIFGEKDYQQYKILSRLVCDMDIPVEVAAGPIIRENDGLAMSSRNAYLSPSERRTAASLNAILRDLKQRAEKGGNLRLLEAEGRQRLLEAGFTRVDYLDFRDAETLKFIDRIVRPARILAVARLGKIRLLDNFPVDPAAGES